VLFRSGSDNSKRLRGTVLLTRGRSARMGTSALIGDEAWLDR
jgi:hypothetical protein